MPPGSSGNKGNTKSDRNLAAAQLIVEAILNFNDITIDDIRPRDLSDHEWLCRLGEGVDWEDWKDPGSERLRVPTVHKG